MKTNKNAPAPPNPNKQIPHHSEIPVQVYSFWQALWSRWCDASREGEGTQRIPFCLLSHNKEQSQQLSSWGKMNFTPQVSMEWMAAPSSLTPVQWTWAEDALLRYTETRGIFVAASAKKISRNSLWMLQNKAKTSCFYFTHRKIKIQKANKTTTQLKYISTFPLLLWLLLQTRSSKWH